MYRAGSFGSRVLVLGKIRVQVGMFLSFRLMFKAVQA